MDSTARTPTERLYEDFEPTMEWAREAGTDTLIVYLPGFNKDQLKVQVTTARSLRLSGERPVDEKKWSRFSKEIQVPPQYDTNGISARFEKGILYVKHPKLIVPAEPPQQPVEPPRAPPEKVQPTPEASIPGPKKPTAEGKLEPSAEAPPRPQDQSTETKTPQLEKIQPTPEASIPGPKKPTEQGKLEPSAEAPPGPEDQSTEAKTPQREKVQPAPEAAVSLKPPHEKGQPSSEPPNSRPEGKKSTEHFNGTTGQKTEPGQPSVDSVLGAAEKDMDSGNGAGKIESESDGFKREILRRDYTGLLMNLKEPGTLINLVLGILLVVVTVLYAMIALRSPSKSEN